MKEASEDKTATTANIGDFLDRRSFLRTSTAAGAGAGLLLTSKSAIAQEGNKVPTVALVGCGAQGRALMESARLLEPLPYRMVAVCDIWESNRSRMAKWLKAYKMPVTEYEDIDEMLEKEKDLDAVIIASPDFMHAPHTIKSLDAGKAVYCEKMMSNTIEAARSMVKAQERTGGLLQIGHQRRSNPRYLNLRNNLFHGNKIFGRVTHAYAQWNRAVTQPLGAEKQFIIPDATLKKYGYDSMEEFRNWRWFSKYGGGPISDLGAHQIDLFNWFFKTTPKSVIASGGVDYYTDYELMDNVMTIYEYDTPEGTSRAYYQVLTTSSSQGFYEKWMGEHGSAAMSEVPAAGNSVYREANAPDSWDPYVAEGLIAKDASAEEVYHKFWQQPKPWTRPTKWLDNKSAGDVRATKGLDPYDLTATVDGRPHTPHLAAFFNAVTKKDPTAVTCTVQEAFATCVTVLSCLESIKTGKKIEFKPEDFVA